VTRIRRATPPAAEPRPVPTASRPGTAVQPKGQQRAAEILRAAHAILVDEGYAALTTRKIAERVGMRQSNVQYYFRAKADLVRALFTRAMAEHARVLARQPGAPQRSPWQRMIRSIDHFLASHRSREEQVFLRELWALSAHDSDVAAVMNGFYVRWIDVTARMLLDMNPRLGRRRAQRRALILTGLVDGLSLFHGAVGVDHPATEGVEREVREVVLALATAAHPRRAGPVTAPAAPGGSSPRRGRRAPAR
jgi:AcrR family transcriptional regulator